jgi:arylsulfatase A-like enzyme
MPTEADQPQTRTFDMGCDFIRRNAQADNWFLQIETFDPHEPFFTQEQYKALYPHEYAGPQFDWPPYTPVNEPPEVVEHVQREYAALISMCDHSLGRVLDLMDELDLWQDTLLIVNTDHGFLLGEHQWWAKVNQPWYNELANTPLFIWDPRSKKQGERRSGLVQMIDLPPTLLEFFGAPVPPDMQGIPLRDAIASDAPTRPAVMYGIFGGQINVTDGRYVYMRGAANPENGPLFEYTLMPTHMRGLFSVAELQAFELAGPFAFTKGCRVMKIPAAQRMMLPHVFTTQLFDLQTDPLQEHPIQDAEVEASMIDHLRRLMKENDAPEEQFIRVGLQK